MDRQGNRGDMFAPYQEVPSRIMVPSPEKASAPMPAPGQPFVEKYGSSAESVGNLSI